MSAQDKMTSQAGKPGQGRGGNVGSRFPKGTAQKPAGTVKKPSK